MMGRSRVFLAVVWLLFLGEHAGPLFALAAQSAAPATKIMASYGGELGYQAPLWVAHEMKLFAKQGLSSELIRIAGGSRSMATLLSNSIHVAQSAGVSTVQADLVGLLHMKRLVALVLLEGGALEIHAELRRPFRCGIRGRAPPDAIS